CVEKLQQSFVAPGEKCANHAQDKYARTECKETVSKVGRQRRAECGPECCPGKTSRRGAKCCRHIRLHHDDHCNRGPVNLRHSKQLCREHGRYRCYSCSCRTLCSCYQ